MISTSRTVEQTNHRLICDALRETMRAGPGAVERVSSIRYRASAVLYLLLLEHPIDERGRCWSCPGVLSGLRPRPCQIHVKASDWLLHHPDEVLRSHLAREFGAASLLSPNVLSPRATGTPPRSGLTVKARPDPAQPPAHPGPLPVREFREAGRPDPAPGGAGVHPEGPRFRRVPPSDEKQVVLGAVSFRPGYVGGSVRRARASDSPCLMPNDRLCRATCRCAVW
jgi:hypothetical protein